MVTIFCFVQGKLLYVYPPPGVDSLEFNQENPSWLEAYASRAKRLQEPQHTQQQAGNNSEGEEGEEDNEEEEEEGQSVNTTSTNTDSNTHTNKSKKKKKQHKKRLQPTIRNPETTEQFMAKQDAVVAHTRKGGRNKKHNKKQEESFTRAKFLHSPIPVADLQAILHQQRLSKKAQQQSSTTQQSQQTPQQQ